LAIGCSNAWGLTFVGLRGGMPSPNQFDGYIFFFFCKSPWGKTLRQRTTTHFTGTFNLIQNNNTVSNCNPLNEITGTHYRTRMLLILSIIKINRSWVVRSIPQEVKIMSIPWLHICFPFPGLGKVNVQIYCHPCISLLFTQPHTHDIPYI